MLIAAFGAGGALVCCELYCFFGALRNAKADTLKSLVTFPSCTFVTFVVKALEELEP